MGTTHHTPHTTHYVNPASYKPPTKLHHASTMTTRVQQGLKTTLLAGLCCTSTLVCAQIFTCIDAKGRKLTSDRPIPECNDREQRVLNPSGTVREKLGPTLTAQERAAVEAKEKLAQEEQARREEEKRRDRALLLRYPNRGLHDAERNEAVAQINVVKNAALNRVEELNRQRKSIGVEMEFYKKDPNKAPFSLRRQIDDVTQSLAVQARFIADQEGETKRVIVRFDEELARLKKLWPQLAATAPPAKPDAPRTR